MILQEQGDQLLIIRQTDHALLAGFLAREWGNGLFKRPELFECFCLAVREHDNGWSEWEQAPQIDPKTRLPYSFTSIPTQEHMALYECGVERILNVDRYAALLVSLHCAGLYDRVRATLPGFSAKYVRSGESALVSEFVQRLKLQQLRLKTELRMNPATKSLAEEKSLQRSARLLEALDRLSLYFCLQPPDDATIDGVPLDDQGGEVDWELRAHGDNRVSLSAYPFRRDPLSISILARRVPKRLYSDASDFLCTLARAPYFAMNFTLSAADVSSGQTQSAVA
jgi:Protein of unknown function (DUF3891)